jgi:hypothetical protein
MSKGEKVREGKLAQLESEFQPLLLACLRECARGRWGLFGQNDRLDPEGRYWAWPEATRLKSLALEIRSIRLEFGQVNELSERFLRLCSSRGAKVPGEPKLASEFLAEIGQNKHSSSLLQES